MVLDNAALHVKGENQGMEEWLWNDHGILEKDVDHVFLSNKTCLKRRKTKVHNKDQGRGYKNPQVVYSKQCHVSSGLRCFGN